MRGEPQCVPPGHISHHHPLPGLKPRATDNHAPPEREAERYARAASPAGRRMWVTGGGTVPEEGRDVVSPSFTKLAGGGTRKTRRKVEDISYPGKWERSTTLIRTTLIHPIYASLKMGLNK